jgi:hypothetical protein
MKTVYFFLFALTTCSLFSCLKPAGDDNACPPTTAVTITTNSPVIVGWPLTLSTADDMSFLYKWSGPNGFNVDYNYHSSTAYLQGKLVTTMADAGVYRIERRYSDGCVFDTGSVVVQIINPPLPPCTVTNNSSTSNVIGVGGVPYGNLYFTGGGGIYTVQGTGGGQSITFHFNGNTPPKPGVYKTSGYFAMDEATVGVYITASPYDFINNSGQDVYVNLVGGKTQVQFCNATFSNPLGSTVIKISAKLTEP